MKEKAEAVAALREADRHKDEFLATLAHELRNPLAPLRNGLEILRMPGADAAVSARAREMMERQLKHMVRLVDDLLDVSRITTGKLAVKKERVELQAVIHIAVETARPFIEARRHALEIDVPATPIWLDADATRLAQVVSNLLNNAARYTEPGGLIEINVSLKDAGVEVSVSDNGIGIPPGLLPTIFDMFTQADQSLERRQAGLGVGLTLARKLIELHGGAIEARSAGLGHGSKFVVSLPVAASQAQSVLPVKDLSVQATATQNQRILLADDNVDFVNSMATLLSAKGHEVRVAHDGVQALKLARDFNPDYAFLDIGMPMMNGYELARRLSKLVGGKTVLTAVSGWGQHGDRLRAVEAGFKHHLVKPVEFEQLEAIILMSPVAT
ncbi:MAG: ATP-binding protein, partial [Betaproteobacteria bacterium]